MVLVNRITALWHGQVPAADKALLIKARLLVTVVSEPTAYASGLMAARCAMAVKTHAGLDVRLCEPMSVTCRTGLGEGAFALRITQRGLAAIHADGGGAPPDAQELRETGASPRSSKSSRPGQAVAEAQQRFAAKAPK